ncbi:MAG: hypothetical protein FJZ56_04750 [Chlamydiae bacterium]|nr:hypothetical protein [Chlamydiota bacterium]
MKKKLLLTILLHPKPEAENQFLACYHQIANNNPLLGNSNFTLSVNPSSAEYIFTAYFEDKEKIENFLDTFTFAKDLLLIPAVSEVYKIVKPVA